jgi:endonuclease/exonuclease/phosphatase family metal-dependent hydrolase
VTLGTSSTPGPAPTTTTGTTLRVLHWNTHHGGVGTDGRYDPGRLATWIAKFNPDVISLNEVEYYTGYGNEDQPARFASLLKQKTGRTWYYKFVTANGATHGNGNMVMSRYPLDVKSRYDLSYDRAAAQVTVHVNGRAINMISTHLDANSTSRRLVEIGQLKTWVSGLAEQRIIAGDFNAWPQTTENAKMVTTYYDSWAEAVKRNIDVAYSGNEEGNTRNTRIDYIYYSHGASGLVLRKVQVFDTRTSGVMPSDHRPIMATFTVK